jgi:signal recognition particle subunit SRP68
MCLQLTYGKRYNIKGLDLDSLIEKATEPRHLLMPLVKAERAWSYAMQLREGGATEPRKRQHMMRRMTKAKRLSDELMKFCAAKADPRTALEAEAYTCYITGTIELERENWAEALSHFSRVRTVYTELGKVTDAEMVDLCQQRVDEVEPSVRYCEYNLKRTGADAAKAVAEFSSQGLLAMDPVLRAKLDHVLDESRKEAAKSMETVTVDGKLIPLKNERLRECLIKANELQAGLAKADSADKKSALYDQASASRSFPLFHSSFRAHPADTLRLRNSTAF